MENFVILLHQPYNPQIITQKSLDTKNNMHRDGERKRTYKVNIV